MNYRLRVRTGAAWILGSVQLALGATFAVPVLALTRLVAWYDALSYRGHSARIRSFISLRASRFVGPLLPLLATSLGLAATAHVGDHISAPRIFFAAGLVALSLVLAEVYSVCLHREAWIASFQPELLGSDYHPLNSPPRRSADSRLQHLLRFQAIYLVGLIAALAAPGNSPSVLGCLVAVPFALKFYGHCSWDYEVLLHWDMHSNVLDLPGAPRRARLWRLLANWVLGPFHGYLPSYYRAHHLVIHHRENAGPDDSHSPLPYNRSSLLEFCGFYLKMLLYHLSGVDVAMHRRATRSTRLSVLTASVVYWLAVALLFMIVPALAVWLILAVLLRTLVSTRAQYIWHGLIDQSHLRHPCFGTLLWTPSPENWGKLGANSDTDAIAAFYGARRPGNVPQPGSDWAFFDNYHVIHHLHPKVHFAEYPELLSRRLPQLVRTGIIMFDMRGLGNFAFYCWSGNIQAIADLLITPMPRERRLAFVSERLAPLESRRSVVGKPADSRVGIAANRVLVAGVYAVTKGR